MTQNKQEFLLFFYFFYFDISISQKYKSVCLSYECVGFFSLFSAKIIPLVTDF